MTLYIYNIFKFNIVKDNYKQTKSYLFIIIRDPAEIGF